MARTIRTRITRHFERVAFMRNDAAKLNPKLFPNRIAATLARADELERRYKAAGLWKQTCGIGCECNTWKRED